LDIFKFLPYFESNFENSEKKMEEGDYFSAATMQHL
jgi:hypothetical protein